MSVSVSCVICDRPLSLPQQSLGRRCPDLQCRTAWRLHLQNRRPLCAVCGRPINHQQQAHNLTTCERRECHLAYLTQRGNTADAPTRCQICDLPLTPDRVEAQVCRSQDCQIVLASHDRQRRERATAEANRRKMESLLQAARHERVMLAAERAVSDVEAWPVTLLPTYSGTVTNLPERRRRAFRDFLNRIISEATEDAANRSRNTRLGADSSTNVMMVHSVDGWTMEAASDTDVADTARDSAAADGNCDQSETSGGQRPRTESAAAVFAAACTMCRGKCCRVGENRAYLSAETMQQFMDLHPELRPRDVMAAYLAHVPTRSYRGSCLFHSETGCNLPRELRSNTCNDFYCDGLKQLKSNIGDGAAARTFLAAVKEGGEEFRATEFVDGQIQDIHE